MVCVHNVARMHQVVGQSKQMQSHCDSVTAAVVALQKAVDTFASTTYKPDTVDEPPRSTYSYPKKFAKTPAYTDTLRDFEADWNEESTSCRLPLRNGGA